MREALLWRFARSAPVRTVAVLMAIALGTVCYSHAATTFSVRSAGNTGFDVFADGVLVAPIRLAANNVLLADTITTNTDGLTLSGLRASDPLAVSFAGDDFVRILVPPAGGTNATGADVPTIQFKLTLQNFNSNRWLALFPEGAAPFHFLACSMATAQVWHQRGWLNATPLADPFPLLQDAHAGSPEISCTWNRNWSYICPLGGHPIPMIGLWDPSAGRYVGYDFQGARAADQSDRYLATAYCWGHGALTNFISLAYPYGGKRYGKQVFPAGGEVLASWFDLQIDTALPATEDPNERFQARLFRRYTNALPPVPAMNDLGWVPGGARLSDFAGPISLNLYGAGSETTYYPTGTVLLNGWRGHQEMPVDTAVSRGQSSSIASARDQLETLLTNYAQYAIIDGDFCMFWQKPLSGAWLTNWGGTAVTTAHESDGWYAARVLVEMYRYDKAQGQVRPSYLPAIDAIFNWTKHFVWTRNEFPDVPSSPFAIGATLGSAFLLDYYYTFRADSQRSNNAALALHLANTVTWRYLHPWAMDSDRFDGALDSAFLVEPNSGRDWAGLGCANEVNWNLDALTQVYVHTGDRRMRYYLRGMLQRWPALYQEIYQDAIADYSSSASLTEGLGVFDGSGPDRGLRNAYGFCPSLPLIDPVGTTTLRVIAGAQACIAFSRDTTDYDVSEYRTGGDGTCSFRIVALSSGAIDVSFSYPFVNIAGLAVTRVRNGVTNVLSGASITRPVQSPSSLYLWQLQNNDLITIGSVPSSARVVTNDNTLVYSEANLRPRTNGLFTTLPFTGEYTLPQQWTNVYSFAGLITGERWAYGIPYHQSLSGRTNNFSFSAPGAAVLLIAYAPRTTEVLTGRPTVLLDNGSTLALSGNPVLAWRGWPINFRQKVLLDFATLPAGRSLGQVQPCGTVVMAVTAFTGALSAWLPYQTNLLAAAATFAQQQAQEQAVFDLQASYAQLPDGRIALLPLDTAGAAADFAAVTGLKKKWVPLTEAQYVNTNYFNASRYPIAFYLGSEHYVKTVNAVGDGKAAITNYLSGGGTLVVLATGPFPFYYGDGPADAAGSADPLLPNFGLPFQGVETVPAGTYMQRYSNQGILHSVANQFAFPTGDQRLRAINRSGVSSLNRYVPLVKTVDGSGTDYGDPAVFVVFNTGSARNGRIVYVWSTLLSGADGQGIMADVVTWILNAVLRPPQPRLDILPKPDAAHFVYGFEAVSNLYYASQFRSGLSSAAWSPLASHGSALTNRAMFITNSLSGGSGFYRVTVGP